MLNIGIKLYDGTLYSVGDVYSVQGAEVVITTIADSQRIAEVELYLIEEKHAANPPFIGKFTIRDIPEAQAGAPRFTLIIKADSSANLNVLVYDKGKLSGKMDIPASGWHPDHKTKMASHITMEKKDAVYKRDFEVHFKSEKEPLQSTAMNAKVLPAVPREEKTHYISHDEAEEKKSGGTGILIAASIAILAIIVIVLLVFKPWSGESVTAKNGDSSTAFTSNTGNTDIAAGSIKSADATPQPEITTEPANAVTPLPTPDPAEAVAAINSKIRDIGNVYFEPNSTKILDNSSGKLALLASLLSESKGSIRVEVRGHTAQIGTEGEQFQLSVERAKLVANEMVARGAIAADSITSRGVGASDPATTDTTRIELNRRVEVNAAVK
jgi:outer membrane protein OmpA-like peptidoglycan-associated protein